MNEATLKPPAVVVELASQVKMTPLAWKVEKNKVVIVFVEGQKLTFDLTQGDPTEGKSPASTPVKQIPVKKAEPAQSTSRKPRVTKK